MRRIPDELLEACAETIRASMLAEGDARDDALVKIAERPLGLALSQAFGAQMYGFILVSLERVGYNAYMGERELDRLHQPAMAAVKAVETRQ